MVHKIVALFIRGYAVQHTHHSFGPKSNHAAKTASNKVRIEIVEGLFAGYVGSNVRVGQPVVDFPALRLKGQNDHNLQPIPGTNSKDKGLIRDCVVCSNTPLAGSSKGTRHRSSYEGSECKKALSIYPCSNGFTRWPCTRQNVQMPFTVCCKYRLDLESKKHVQQQNATEGARHLVLGILPPTL